MAAVRCAARRLSGSLLQRTQAAVTEEGRRPAPSRLMRSRELSSKVSGEHARNMQKKEDDIWAGFNETLKRTAVLPKKRKPSVFQQRMMLIEGVTKTLACGAFKVIVVYVAACAAFDGVKF